MGSMYIMNARGRIIEKIDDEMQSLPTLLKQRNYLCDLIYDIVHKITDECTLKEIEEYLKIEG